jgi:hypothetical protein
MGWSGGGHMTNKIITHTDRFKATSSGSGAVTWISMYGQTFESTEHPGSVALCDKRMLPPNKTKPRRLPKPAGGGVFLFDTAVVQGFFGISRIFSIKSEAFSLK